ncbi:glutaredoxin family protein [Aquibacillus halophilus]|uniref:Glutaredoxin family protein n=1 Tax=Aquibacillus halophilus TaxID=930132 RepID=A0A6A8D8F0_9BACI|nr:glutaredoxin family protein [Aquibacillus halophilus]
MKTVTFYTKQNCPLCDEAKQLLYLLKDEFNFEFDEIDIYTNDQLLEQYQLMIPVVSIDGQDVDYGQINYDFLRQDFVNRYQKK